MQFKPNFDLLRDWASAEKSQNFASNSAYVAIFRKDDKTLVYMCDMHMHNMVHDLPVFLKIHAVHLSVEFRHFRIKCK